MPESKTAKSSDKIKDANEKAREASAKAKEASTKTLAATKDTFKKAREKSGGFRKEFMEFINRGSVVDLAVGVAVGGAFTAIVNSLVDDIVMPIVSLLMGGADFTQLAIRIPNFFGGDTEAVIAYGNFIQNIVQFLVIAWVIFLIVKAMNRMHRKKDAENEKDA